MVPVLHNKAHRILIAHVNPQHTFLESTPWTTSPRMRAAVPGKGGFIVQTLQTPGEPQSGSQLPSQLQVLPWGPGGPPRCLVGVDSQVSECPRGGHCTNSPRPPFAARRHNTSLESERSAPTKKCLTDAAHARPPVGATARARSLVATPRTPARSFSKPGQSKARHLLVGAEEFHRRAGARVAEHFAQSPLLPKASAQVHVDVPSDWNDAAAGACRYCESICLC